MEVNISIVFNHIVSSTISVYGVRTEMISLNGTKDSTDRLPFVYVWIPQAISFIEFGGLRYQSHDVGPQGFPLNSNGDMFELV